MGERATRKHKEVKIEVMEKEGLRWINPDDYRDRILTPEEILQWFDLCDAAWVYDGDPKKPHAELSSGKCSNGFFDCARVLCYPNLSEILARQLVRQLLREGIGPVDYVVGSAYAAITFSYDVARVLREFLGFSGIHCLMEKDPADQKKMVWRRIAIPGGDRVLQIEELITTSNTFKEVRRAIETGNGEPVEFLSIVGALVHRPPKLPVDYNGRKVSALIEREVWAVDQEGCQLCKDGSIRYSPKTHWAELTGKK